jgi:hypothetical protein
MPYSVLLIHVIRLVVIRDSHDVDLVMEVMKVMVMGVIKYGCVRENVLLMESVLVILIVNVIL